MTDLLKTVVNSVMGNQGEEVMKDTPEPEVAALAKQVNEEMAMRPWMSSLARTGLE